MEQFPDVKLKKLSNKNENKQKLLDGDSWISAPVYWV